MKIAVLGLGRMGQALAYRLQEGGHDLTVWNRTPGRADELVRAGATEADSPGDAVAAVEVAVSSLANDDAVRDLALGADGVLAAMGSRPYLDASTVSPRLSGELADNSPVSWPCRSLVPPKPSETARPSISPAATPR